MSSSNATLLDPDVSSPSEVARQERQDFPFESSGRRVSTFRAYAEAILSGAGLAHVDLADLLRDRGTSKFQRNCGSEQAGTVMRHEQNRYRRP